MNTFSKLAVLAAFVATTSFAAMPASASAATKCDAHGIGGRTLTHDTNNTAYKIHGDQTTVTFDVSGCAKGIDVTMISWKAPNGTTGKPYSQQVMYAHKTGHFSNGRHSMSVALPDCYFQIDTVTGTKLTGSTGEAYNYDTRQVAFMHGGSKSCTEKKVTNAPTKVTPTPPTVTPQTPTTPTTPTTTSTPTAPTPTATVQAKELPHTGPEAALGTFLSATGAGTLVHRYVSRKARRS